MEERCRGIAPIIAMNVEKMHVPRIFLRTVHFTYGIFFISNLLIHSYFEKYYKWHKDKPVGKTSKLVFGMGNGQFFVVVVKDAWHVHFQA